MSILRACRKVSPPEWVVGAGAIRTTVWDSLHGFSAPTPLRDVDVCYFDAADLGTEKEKGFEHELSSVLPDVEWEVRNQAGVHLWYEEKFGQNVPPLRSIPEAVASWPETATSVAARLLRDDSLEIVAPLGLTDLFGLILRRNPARASRDLYLRRLMQKRIAETWPRVTVLYD